MNDKRNDFERDNKAVYRKGFNDKVKRNKAKKFGSVIIDVCENNYNKDLNDKVRNNEEKVLEAEFCRMGMMM